MVPRSFSPTKDSSATTSVKDNGKKPMTSTTKGIKLSRIRLPPKRFIKLTAWRVVSSAMKGKSVTRRNIGTTIRQSRNWSVNSRCATIQTAERLRCIAYPLGIGHGLEVHLFQFSGNFLEGHQRSLTCRQRMHKLRIYFLRRFDPEPKAVCVLCGEGNAGRKRQISGVEVNRKLCLVFDRAQHRPF